MVNQIKSNGILLGGAFGGLLAFFVQKQAVSLWNIILEGSQALIDSWVGFAGLTTNIAAYFVFIIIGLSIGYYVESK